MLDTYFFAAIKIINNIHIFNIVTQGHKIVRGRGWEVVEV
jgi:hypothetical protein